MDCSGVKRASNSGSFSLSRSGNKLAIGAYACRRSIFPRSFDGHVVQLDARVGLDQVRQFKPEESHTSNRHPRDAGSQRQLNAPSRPLSFPAAEGSCFGRSCRVALASLRVEYAEPPSALPWAADAHAHAESARSKPVPRFLHSSISTTNRLSARMKTYVEPLLEFVPLAANHDPIPIIDTDSDRE